MNKIYTLIVALVVLFSPLAAQTTWQYEGQVSTGIDYAPRFTFNGSSLVDLVGGGSNDLDYAVIDIATETALVDGVLDNIYDFIHASGLTYEFFEYDGSLYLVYASYDGYLDRFYFKVMSKTIGNVSWTAEATVYYDADFGHQTTDKFTAIMRDGKIHVMYNTYHEILYNVYDLNQEAWALSTQPEVIVSNSYPDYILGHSFDFDESGNIYVGFIQFRNIDIFTPKIVKGTLGDWGTPDVVPLPATNEYEFGVDVVISGDALHYIVPCRELGTYGRDHLLEKVYSIGSDTWASGENILSDLLRTIAAYNTHCIAVSTNDGRIYLTYAEYGYPIKVKLYDPVLETWSSLSSPSTNIMARPSDFRITRGMLFLLTVEGELYSYDIDPEVPANPIITFDSEDKLIGDWADGSESDFDSYDFEAKKLISSTWFGFITENELTVSEYAASSSTSLLTRYRVLARDEAENVSAWSGWVYEIGKIPSLTKSWSSTHPKISWSYDESDLPNGDFSHYQIQKSKNGGPWYDTPGGGTTIDSFYIDDDETQFSGGRYAIKEYVKYRVRVVDVLGNASKWTACSNFEINASGGIGLSNNAVDLNSAELLPATLIVSQNYPNPFNPSTTLRFGIPEAAEVSLKVYNASGQKVLVLAEQQYEAGFHQLSFYAGNLPSGIYYCNVKAGKLQRTIKMLLAK